MDPVVLFCQVDDFCKVYQREIAKAIIGVNHRDQWQKSLIRQAEVMTIKIWYHLSGFKTFKDFYTRQEAVLRSYFSNLLSYSRMVELCIEQTFALIVYAKIFCTVKSNGIDYIDSTKLEVSHIKRSSSHKTFAGLAKKGHTSMGWFYGFKLHLIVNPWGEVVDFDITSGNIADNNANLLRRITKKVKNKLFGDRGYMVNKDVFAELFSHGVQMISRVRKNMKTPILTLEDKILLSKRGLVESVIGILKQSLDLEHSRHRNPMALFAHVASTLIAYFFRPNKPSISLPAIAIAN